MKNATVLIFAAAVMSLHAADHDMYDNSLYVVAGYAINSAGTELDNTTTWGFRFNQNRADPNALNIDAYQFSLDYSGSNKYAGKTVETSALRLGGNLLWYIDNDSDITPFIMLGAGVQYLGNASGGQDTLGLFGALGGGAEYQLRSNLSFVAEGKMLYHGSEKSSLLTNVGIKYSFGQE